MTLAASRVLALTLMLGWVCSAGRPRRRPTWHALGIPAERAARWRWN